MSNTADTNLPPPVPPTVIPSIVDTLEPELAAAYRAGNPSIMQAVAAGATTTQMVVNDIIRMGASAAGLPAGVQLLVDERKKEMDLKAKEENDALKKLAAGVLGFAMAETNPAHASEFYGEGNSNSKSYSASNPPSVEQFNQMNDSEKTAYRSRILATTNEEWAAAGAPARAQTIEIAKTDANDAGQKAGLTVLNLTTTIMNDAELGDEKARQASIKKINAHASAWLEKNPGKTVEDYANDIQCQRNDLSEREQKYAVELLGIKQSSSAAEIAKAEAVVAAENETSGNPSKSLEHVKTATTHTQKATDTLKKTAEVAANMPAASAKAEASAALVQSNAAMSEGDMATHTTEDKANYRSVADANLDARQKIDIQVSKNEVKADLADGGFDSEPAKPALALASAAPRLSINAQPLAAAGQLQEPGVVAANDPAPAAIAPAAPEQRRPSTSAGMNA